MFPGAARRGGTNRNRKKKKIVWRGGRPIKSVTRNNFVWKDPTSTLIGIQSPEKMERRSRHLLFAVLAVVLTVSASSMGGGLTTPDAAAGVAGATASGLFNIRPLSIFTGHCNASIARGATIWKPIPGVVDIFFPKVVSVPRLPFLLHYLMCVCSSFFFCSSWDSDIQKRNGRPWW